MQLILAVISYLSTFIFMYLIADLIMWAYNSRGSRRQKALLAFVTGTLMQSTFVYVVYYIGGMVSFSKTAYLLVTTPNPIFALLYCYFGIRILKLSPLRSIKVMGKFYLYYIFIRSIYRLIGSAFYVQTEPRYNYLLDAVQQLVCMGVTFLIYFCTRFFFKRIKVKLSTADVLFADFRHEMFMYTERAFLGWLSFVLIPLLIAPQLLANLVNSVILFIMLLNYILLDYSRALEVNAENNELYIHALTSCMDSFTGVKHDFYNILQTYSGYLEIGDLEKLKVYHLSLVKTTTNAGSSVELGKRLDENPALISLLINKLEYAEKRNVKLKIRLMSTIEDFYIDNVSICRVIGSLLDDAIEAAAVSERKTVLMTVEDKPGYAKLIVISNSKDGEAGAEQRTQTAEYSGIGQSSVRRIVEKHGNCMFRNLSYQDEFTAYLETRKQS